MGHRGLVAYLREDGRFNVHYTHWGACNLELCQDISPESPFGGEENEPEFINSLLSALDGSGLSMAGRLTEPQQATAVDVRPLAEGYILEDVVAELNFITHEAFYIVDREFNCHGFRTLWTDLCDHKDRSEYHREGVLVQPRFYNGEPVGDGNLNGWFSGVKEVVGDLVGDGTLTVEEGERELVERVLGRCAGRLDEYALAVSPQVTDDDWREFPSAFFNPHGLSRRGSVLIPQSIPDDFPSWAVPADFSTVANSPSARTLFD